MNKRLFVVRSATRKLIVIAVLTVFVAACIFVAIQLRDRSKSFLKYHDKTYYSPSNKAHNGFYGKANDILAEALAERTGVSYRLDSLDTLYKRLKFYYPANSDTYLDVSAICYTLFRGKTDHLFAGKEMQQMH